MIIFRRKESPMKTFFVSSTFRDMDEERDAIQQITLPLLNAVARIYGESVSFCDLRWGVDTAALESDDGSRKVLDVCLDEIDRCKPPMVVILGYRYGWLPPEELIEETVKRRCLSLDNLEKSVTALEIEYGALPEALNSRTLFYFREFDSDIPAHCASEDEKHFALLKQLKDRIVRLSGGHVKTYRVRWNGQNLDGIQDFARTLAEDLKALMLPLWEENNRLTPREKELHTHRSYLLQKASLFHARNAFAEELVEKIKNGETKSVIKDVSGSGKSTFFAHLALRLEEEGFTVFPLFSGLTSESCTAIDILQKTVFFLEEALQLSHPLEQPGDEPVPEKKWRQRLDELCLLCRENENLRLVIMVDAVDQLLPDDLRDNLLFVPRELSGSLRLVLTCLESFSTKDVFFRSFPPFGQTEKEEMICAILNAHHRELSKAVISAMAALPQSDNPLYISMLIQRMLLMDRRDFDRIRELGDGMDAIIAHQLELLNACPKQLNPMCAMVLEVAGTRINPRLISCAAKFLALSRRGLRQEDLQGLLGVDFNMLDFSHFVIYMSDSFILRSDGRYDFSHRSIREGYTQLCDSPQEIHRQLIRYFLSLDESDPLRRTELVYHMVMGDAGEELISYIERYENHEDTSIIRSAAATLFDSFRSGRQEFPWFISLMESAEIHGGGQNLVRFLVRDLRRAGTRSNLDEVIKATALQAACGLAERLTARGADLRRDYAKALYFLPDSLKTTRTPDEQLRKSSVLIRLLSLHLLHTLRMEDPTRRARLDEARACKALAGAYNGSGFHPAKSFFYIDKAISLATELLQEEETRDVLLFLSDCYARRADLGSRLLDSSVSPTACHAQALSDQQKNLNCIRRLSEAFPQEDNRRIQCIAFQQTGDTLTQLGGTENNACLRRALGYYKKALELADALNRENRDLDSCIYQADCRMYIADILVALGRKKYSGQILENLAAEQDLRVHILFIQKTNRAYQMLANVFKRRGRHRILCDPAPASLEKAASDLKKAIGLYRIHPSGNRIDDIEEILQKEQKSLAKDLTPAYYDLSTALGRLGRKEEADSVRQNAQKLHRLFMSGEQSYSYAEILEILRYIPPQYAQAIPYTLINLFWDYYDRQYKLHLNSSVPLQKQETSPKTNSLLAVLTVNYMAEQKEEEELFSIFDNNQKIHDSDLDQMDEQALIRLGDSCRESDPSRAFRCYQCAADMGNEEARLLTAYCFWDGSGTCTDFEKCIAELDCLAREGSPEISVRAAAGLGLRLMDSHFYEDGLPWLQKAAELGSEAARRRLVRVYEKGEGVVPDKEQAAFWRGNV